MGIKCGIVGLPNVGKSTLFNALTKAGIAAANYPFCTIDPNVGVVPVPDPRLDALSKIAKPLKIIPTTIEFVDMGQMHHNGGTNYFSWTAFTPDGRSHAIATIDQIGAVLVKEGLMDPRALAEAQAASDMEAKAYEAARVAEAAAAQRAKRDKKTQAA